MPSIRWRLFKGTSKPASRMLSQNVEGRVNLYLWILVLVVEYSRISFYFALALNLRPRANTCVYATIININRPDGITYFQTVYVPKYSPRTRVVSATVGS